MNRILLVLQPAFLLALLAAGAIAGDAPAPLRLPALADAERDLLAEAAENPQASFDLIDGALIASGVTDRAQRDRWLRVRDARYAALDLASIARLPADRRPAAILAGMHREILAGRFRPSATLMHETLETGDFNCVTATILYHDLCARCGVPVETIAQSGHVHSRLVGTPSEEVETTRRDWFTRETDSIAHVTQKPAVVVRRVITPPQLLGRVYYNRALAALEQQQFAPAIGWLQVSLALDPHDRDARENILAGYNNWALALCEAGDHAAAADKIAAGLTIDQRYPPLRINEVHVHQQWVCALCQRADYAAAVTLLEAGRSRRPDAPLFSAGQKSVFEAWFRDCTARGDSAAALEVLHRAKQHLGAGATLSVEARPVGK